MRPLTPKEKVLLTLFLALLFIVGNLIGLPALHRQQKKLQTQLVNLRAEQETAAMWLKEKELWTERKAWLDAKQPKMTSTGDASSSFLETLQQSAKLNKIKIVEQKLLEPEKHPGYQAVAVRMTVNGNLEAIVKWLSAIQQPESFQAVLKFNLKIDGEAPNMRCDLDLARWYAPAS